MPARSSFLVYLKGLNYATNGQPDALVCSVNAIMTFKILNIFSHRNHTKSKKKDLISPHI